MKALYVFGLQTQTRSDISDWSQELHTAFHYFNNKQQEYKEMAVKVPDTFFDKTYHNSYVRKINFGRKQKFRHHKNPALYLVILMWLRQLQQCFFEKSEQNPLRDWNKYGWYYGTGTGFISGRPTLSNINMSTVKSGMRTPVTDVSYFEPNEKRDEVVTSLEEWAARLLKPDITDILKVARKNDSNTKRRFWRAKNPTNFQLTDTNYTTTGNDVCDNKPTYNCSPARNSDKTTNEVLLNIRSVVKSALTSVQKKKTTAKDSAKEPLMSLKPLMRVPSLIAKPKAPN